MKKVSSHIRTFYTQTDVHICTDIIYDVVASLASERKARHHGLRFRAISCMNIVTIFTGTGVAWFVTNFSLTQCVVVKLVH